MFQEIWNDKELHKDPEQQKRQKSACDKKLTPLRIDTNNTFGYFKTYETSLSSCTCRDFIMRRLPCKHMYRLAHELKLFTLPSNVESSETAILVSASHQNKVIDKSTGEIISYITRDDAINNLDDLSPISLKTLKDILHGFVYSKANAYFFLNKSVATELTVSEIVFSLNIDVLLKLDYADRSDLLIILKSINSEKIKNLNPRAITKTIRKFISTNLVDEINQLEDAIFVLIPNPHLQDNYTSIYRAIFKKYTEANFCYNCYLKEHHIDTLDPDTYFFSNDVFCSNCHNICDGLIRVLKR